MDNPLPAAPKPSRINGVHLAMLLLSIINLGGVWLLAWQLQDFSSMPQQEAFGDSSALLRDQLEQSKRLLAEGRAKTSVVRDFVIYQSKEHGFRVVTTEGCEAVYSVRSGQAMPELRALARYDIYLKDPTSYWSHNPLRALLIIDSEDVASLQADRANKDNPAVHSLSISASTAVYLSPERDYRVYQFLGGDGPSPEELQDATRSGSCRYVVQAIPTLGE